MEPVRLNRLRTDIPDDVARFVALLLEKTPQTRPGSAEAVIGAIERLEHEQGGRSAIPAALSAFVKEQTSGPTLRLLTPVPRVSGKKPTASKAAKRKRLLPVVALAAAALAVIIGLGLLVVPLSEKKNEAPVLDAVVFDGDSPIVAGLPESNYRFAEVAWEPKGSVALVRATGRSDTLAFGTSGTLAVDLQEKVCRSLSAPRSATPHDYAYHPNGQTCCLVENATDGTQVLVEKESPAARDARRFAEGIHIVPASARYSPDGARVGYIRNDGNREFWRVNRTSANGDKALLAVGLLGDRFAFSPDGELAAVMLPSESGGAEPDLCIIDTTRGEIRSRLGSGYIDMTSWHPSGKHLLVAAAQGGNARQLWLVTVEGGERRALTELPDGVGTRLAVSPAGEWAAVLANQHAQASVAFVRIDDPASVPSKAASADEPGGPAHA